MGTRKPAALWCVIFLCLSHASYGEGHAMIKGTAPGLEGKTLAVRIPGNPFMDRPRWMLEVPCNNEGVFQARIPLSEGSYVQIATLTHLAGIYLEPGQHCEVELPPSPELSYKDIVSPFFSPAEVHLQALDSPSDLNHRVVAFEGAFSRSNELVIEGRRLRNAPETDSLITTLELEFGSGEAQAWFDDYRSYRYGILELNAGKSRLAKLSATYLGTEVQEGHPAYMDLFGQMFKDFLIYYDQSDAGRGILREINRVHDLDSLRWRIQGHPAVLDSAMADLILLQELPSLFYRGDLHKEAILILLDSLESHPARPSFGTYAAQLKNKLSSLMPGNPPPAFRLSDVNGRSLSLDDFKGKYTYLMFCTPDHYACMMEYPFLQSYLPKHEAYLEPVCIMVAESAEEVKDFVERNQYRFTTLYYEEDKALLNRYQVKAFPVAYLMGPDGKLILSPSALPSEKFEQRLFQIMRARGDI